MQYRQKKLNILLFILAILTLPICSQPDRVKLPVVEWLRDNLDNNKLLECVEWTTVEGEPNELSFLITKPKVLAKKWGEYKGFSAMTYEKMSRGMRNSYKKGILAKHKKVSYCYYFITDSNAKKITSNLHQSLSSDSQTAIPQREQGQVKAETGDVDLQSLWVNNAPISSDDASFKEFIDGFMEDESPNNSP